MRTSLTILVSTAVATFAMMAFHPQLIPATASADTSEVANAVAVDSTTNPVAPDGGGDIFLPAESTSSKIQNDTAAASPANEPQNAPATPKAVGQEAPKPVTQPIVETAPAATPMPAPRVVRAGSEVPVRLRIPSIDMTVPIVPVGLNKKGEMDVPSGNSNNVGWYKYGTVPGHTGSAVLDAHVFAAFEDLRHVPIGADIYVDTEGGERLHFVVQDSRVYKLSELTSQMLFGRNDAKRLNLITCAGTFVKSIDTYDHRLVVYAVLAK